ncbi:MAG TPA: PQQ-binding-like beta-propeller repeat protein, partial [Usitatibacter sp.]|nr:PQQ-binding-like beta-propeller repeat protein [Usitatibacter sp.]
GILYALDSVTGRLAWQQRFGADLGTHDYWDYFVSSPLFANGSIVVGAGDGYVRSFEARTGRLRWKLDTGSRVRSTPAVAEGFVVVGTVSGHVVAIHERDGTLAWRFATAGASHTFEEISNDVTSVMATPTIFRGPVFVGARDGFLYAIDLRRGEQLWRTTHDESSWILSTLTDEERLYVGSGSAMIVQAADPATGAELWRSAASSAIFARVVRSGDTLVVADFTGNVFGLDRRTGERLWQFPMGGRSLSTPTVADGIVYCASDSGILFALDVGEKPKGPTGTPRRIVYNAGAKAGGTFGWFQNGVDAAMTAQLKGRGYEVMDTEALAAFMRAYDSRSPRALVVVADNRIAPALVADFQGAPLIRRFLDAGGKVAILGPNPLAYVPDESGALERVDFAIPSRVFGVTYAAPQDANGYYPSAPSRDGLRAGMRSGFVGMGAVIPDASTVVLARDEFGRATAWLRSYGGEAGTGLLQLAAPRMETSDLAQLQAVMEYGITW